MKKLFALLSLCALCASAVNSSAAVARSEAVNIITAGNWTNGVIGSPIQLVVAEAFNGNAPTGTVTLTRIAGTRTNAVGSITLSGSAGKTYVTAPYVFEGDQIRAVLSAGATNVVLELTGVEATVQRDVLNVASNNASYVIGYGFQNQKLLGVEAFNCNCTTGTVTLSRIRNLRTNTVGAITLSSGAGTLDVSTNNIWVLHGDVLRAVISGALATNVVLEITKDLGL